jgi:hypothetical protein
MSHQAELLPTMPQIIKAVKDNGEDFEFYPSHNKIIEALKADINKELVGNNFSVMDIGAGNGKVLTALSKDEGHDKSRAYSLYAVEKSQTLINAMNKNVFIVGTEFKEQILIDKQVDVTYSNPPYSEYAEWANKIIRESNSGLTYLLLPRRWAKNPLVLTALDDRNAEAVVVDK